MQWSPDGWVGRQTAEVLRLAGRAERHRCLGKVNERLADCKARGVVV